MIHHRTCKALSVKGFHLLFRYHLEFCFQRVCNHSDEIRPEKQTKKIHCRVIFWLITTNSGNVDPKVRRESLLVSFSSFQWAHFKDKLLSPIEKKIFLFRWDEYKINAAQIDRKTIRSISNESFRSLPCVSHRLIRAFGLSTSVWKQLETVKEPVTFRQSNWFRAIRQDSLAKDTFPECA